MGRIKQGITGPVSGKVGAVIGASWKGINYLRGLPRNRGANRTEDEARNQNKFSVMHKWLKPMLPFIREGFKGYSPTVEGFNAAKSYNLRNAFIDVNGERQLDPSLVLVSYGDLPLPENIRCEVEGKELKILWDPGPINVKTSKDQVMFVAFQPGGSGSKRILAGEFRQTGIDKLEIPSGEYHVYVAFVSSDRKRRSNSFYAGMVTV
jgi:hypothetical protein